MRKLKLQMHMTVDGFVAGPNGELDWMSSEVDPNQIQFLKGVTVDIDTIILGRKMAEEAIPHWEGVVEKGSDASELDYANTFVTTSKIVFSKTRPSFAGKNVTVENGDLVTAVNKLKKIEGKDIIVYGGAHFVAALIKNRLIDEYYLLINQKAIGNGLTIFDHATDLHLVKAVAFNNGVVAMQYEPPDK